MRRRRRGYLYLCKIGDPEKGREMEDTKE